jgi:DNA polymerase II small subunit
MEPQPLFDEKFAWPLYHLENVVLTGNPAQVSIGVNECFSGFKILTYHGFSFPYYANNVDPLVLEKAMNCPEKIMQFLLRHRHLSPTHASTQFFPHVKDPLLIKQIPDIFVSGHSHKSGLIYYNNILLVSVSSWESMTPYQEKFGNEPDHCKVPIFNLKTREVKVLDFETDSEGNKEVEKN